MSRSLKFKSIQAISFIALLMLVVNSLYAHDCGPSSITFSYYRSDITIKGVVCEIELTDVLHVVAVKIKVTKDYKSNQSEVIAYLYRPHFLIFDNEGLGVGDQIILLHSSRYNTPSDLRSRMDQCVTTNIAFLKNKRLYLSEFTYNLRKKYFEDVEATVNWLSSLPVPEIDPNSCLINLNASIPVMTTFSRYMEASPMAISYMNSKTIHVIVQIVDENISGFQFSENATIEDKEKIAEIFADLRCICLYNLENGSIPISLALFQRENTGRRI